MAVARTVTADMPVTLDEQVRVRVKAWIRAHQITQAELAAATGTNPTWMSRYLNGETTPDLETLDRLARAFGHTSITALFDVVPNREDAEVLEYYHALQQRDRTLIYQLLKRYSHPRRHGKNKTVD